MLNLPDAKRLQNQFDIREKVALVTGAASGFGQMIAWTLACNGAKVALADIHFEGLQPLSEHVEASFGYPPLCIRVDVTDEAQVRQMVEKTVEHHGRIDVAVNNPGINCRKPALELSLDEFEKVLQVNLRGVFLCAREVGKVMVEQKSGKIINMASMLGLVAMPVQTAYASSKGAVVQLTKVLALEWAEHNVQVNALAPGFFKTPLTEQLSADFRQNVIDTNPQHRFAEIEELMGSVIFLASRASDFVTGTALVVDGGWTAK